jgi:hypothetical protein
MRIRLTEKPADRLDGVDLTSVAIGDVLEIPDQQALCLILERWAVPEKGGDRIALNRPAAFAGSPGAAHRRRRKRI